MKILKVTATRGCIAAKTPLTRVRNSSSLDEKVVPGDGYLEQGEVEKIIPDILEFIMRTSF